MAMHAPQSGSRTPLQGTDGGHAWVSTLDTPLLLLKQRRWNEQWRLPTPAHLHLHQRSAHYQEHALPALGPPLLPLGLGWAPSLQTLPCVWLGVQGGCMLLQPSVHMDPFKPGEAVETKSD